MIEKALCDWEAAETSSQQLLDLVTAFRGWVEYGKLSRDGLSNSEYDSIPNLYRWICDTMCDAPEKILVTNAVRKAAACLGLKPLFEGYVRSLRKTARPEAAVLSPPTASAAAAPAAAAPAAVAASPITITVTNITAAPTEPAEPAEPEVQEETILPAQELPSHTESPIPPNYIATKNMLNYMTDKMLLLSEEDRIYAIIRKYEYLLDKDDFMAYDAEVRNNANVYLDMTITMFPIPPHLYQQLILVRTYLLQMMHRLPDNKYYRKMLL
jgi:hypothetical protein